MSYGPARAASDHAWREHLKDPAPTDEVMVRRAVERAHDPALGLDASICKRTVIDMLRQRALDPIGGEAADLAADWLEARFTERPDA